MRQNEITLTTFLVVVGSYNQRRQMISEKEILKGCAKSDRKAQKALYDLYSGRLMAVCRRYAKSTQEAEDILQESFIKIFKSVDKFRGESRLDYWMKRIVVNTALNHQRSKLYLFPMVDVEDISMSTNKDFALEKFQLEDLLKMVESLPTGCRVIFNLYAIEGFNHNEISDMLEISTGTSKSQYARAKKLLQDKILNEKGMSYGNG